MSRRATQDCPLCALGTTEFSQVYHEYQKTRSFEEAAKKASSLGAVSTPAEARSHFQYHRIIQPAPLGNLKRKAALSLAGKLPQRLQDILVLVGRVRGISATQLAEIFYWDGTEKQLTSARNACYRDLRRLVLDDLLYRYYPVSPASARGYQKSYQEQMSLYFLGRDALPYLEEREGQEITRRDYVTGVRQLGEGIVSQEQESAEVICALSRQVKLLRAQGVHPEVAGAPPLDISFSPLNWYGRERAAMSFQDPRQGVEETITPRGLVALGLSAPGHKFSVLSPFFYEYDTGAKTVSSFAQDLTLYLHLSRTAALSEHFNDLPRDYFPPIVIVCRDMGRVMALQEEVHKHFRSSEKLPVMVIADEVTHLHHGLAGHCWLSLWDRSLEAKRFKLIEVLLRSCRPLVGQLSAESLLTTKKSPSLPRDVQ